jgi:hypothetical protein
MVEGICKSFLQLFLVGMDGLSMNFAIQRLVPMEANQTLSEYNKLNATKVRTPQHYYARRNLRVHDVFRPNSVLFISPHVSPVSIFLYFTLLLCAQIRRVYDVANVLCSLSLINKVVVSPPLSHHAPRLQLSQSQRLLREIPFSSANRRARRAKSSPRRGRPRAARARRCRRPSGTCTAA